MTKDINTHGLKMDIEGLIEASDYTRDKINPIEAKYDAWYAVDTGEVWATYDMKSDWRVYHDKAVMHVWSGSHYIAPQLLADKIASTVERADAEGWLPEVGGDDD